MKRFKLTYPDPEEDDIHEAIARVLFLALPANCWWTSVESRNVGPIEGAKRKARGVRKGVHDIFLCYGRVLHVIEVKTRTGVLSKDQKDMRDELLRSGAYFAVCRSVNEVLSQLSSWGIPLRARIAA